MHTIQNEYPKVTMTRATASQAQHHVCYGPACAEFYLTLGSGGAGFANGLCITIESTPPPSPTPPPAPPAPPSNIRTPAEAMHLEALLWDSISNWQIDSTLLPDSIYDDNWENDYDTWD